MSALLSIVVGTIVIVLGIVFLVCLVVGGIFAFISALLGGSSKK
jgi:hypothetical protein